MRPVLCLVVAEAGSMKSTAPNTRGLASPRRQQTGEAFAGIDFRCLEYTAVRYRELQSGW